MREGPTTRLGAGSHARRGPHRGGSGRTEPVAPWLAAVAELRLRSRFVPLGLLLGAWLALLPGLRWSAGIDGISYISIAAQYADGHLWEAVNPYWSPLLSWLIAPPLALGVEPLLAAHLVVLVTGVLALVAVRRLVVLAGARPVTGDLLCLATVPTVLAAATYYLFADLLFAALLLVWLGLVLDSRILDDRRRAVAAGAVAGLAYLAKLYALPLVLAALPVVAVLLVLAGGASWRSTVRALGTSLAVVALVVGTWATVLSVRTGGLTLGTSAGHNVALVAPGSLGNPIHWAGFLEPSTPDAVSAWDDPGSLPRSDDGWTSSERVAAQRMRENVTRNAGTAASTGWHLAPGLVVLAGLGLVVTGIAVRRDRQTATGRRRLVVLGGTVAVAAVYLGGYLVLVVEERYLWFIVLALVPLAARALDALLPSGAHGRWPRALVVTLVALSLALPALDGVRERWDDGAKVHDAGAALASRGVALERVGSANFWQRGALLCLQRDCRFYGSPEPESPEPLLDQAQAAGLDQYLVWLAVDDPDPMPFGSPAVAREGTLAVYEVPASDGAPATAADGAPATTAGGGR